MRAFYASYKHIRVFILGVPEGWQVSVYDLERRSWQVDNDLHETLKEAKAAGELHVAQLAAKRLPGIKWH